MNCNLGQIQRQASKTQVVRHLTRLLNTGVTNPNPTFTEAELNVFNQQHLSKVASSGTPAFAFDIDGVLLKDSQVIGNSRNMIQAITSRARGGHHPTGIPYIFLTNGGGMRESVRAKVLSEQFGVDVHESQVCLSHTPLRTLVSVHGGSTFLASGKGEVADVARSYGFADVITPQELKHKFGNLVPHCRSDPNYFPDAKPARREDTAVWAAEAHEALLRVGAICVMHDPRDWYVEMQLLLDILVARRMQDPTPLGQHQPYAVQDAQYDLGLSSEHACIMTASAHYKPLHTPLYLSNADLLFSTNVRLPRLAQGAFAECLSHLYWKITGEPLEWVACGKPTPATYAYATTMLEGQLAELRAELSGSQDAGSSASAYGSTLALNGPIQHIYGIGDNPHADIEGANRAGPQWSSVLVQTGTIKRSDVPIQQPNLEFSTVDEAVKAIVSYHATARINNVI